MSYILLCLGIFLLNQATFSQISNERVIKNGLAYVNHNWTADSVNIQNTFCGSKIVVTPPWVKVGANTGIPYCWGGSSTPWEFDKHILMGKSAGDAYSRTIFGAEPRCAVGVDCSGFLSRCYELRKHYSTKDILKSSLFGYYKDYNSLRIGDFIHKPGKHVRLVTKINPNGTIEVVEAGSGIINTGVTGIWKVFVSSYSAAKLNEDGYEAQFYKNMTSGKDTLDCSNAIVLNCGVPYRGSPSEVPSKVIKYGCGWTESGPERIHKITTTSKGDLIAKISDFKGDLDVFILGSCNPLDCRGKISRASVTYKNAPAGTYYIVVDADDGSGSAYTLKVTGNCRRRK